MRYAVIALCVLLAGCESSVQTSSGQEYLSRYTAPTGDGKAAQADRAVASAANVEPLLKLPAKFALARIDRGQLSAIPAEELAAWAELVKQNTHLGEFVLLSPFVTAMANAVVPPESGNTQRDARSIFEQIRVGAARQHADAVLVYEVVASSERQGTVLSILDWTIIGLLVVPSRSVDSFGVASALLFDVRNGYPYITASARSKDSRFTTASAAGDATKSQEASVKNAAAIELMKDLQPAFAKLQTELAAKRKVAER
jgi:rhombotail lipoprotein